MNKKLTIDKFDLKLLSILEQDARQSLSSMAKQLHTSQQVVSYRMQSLEKKSIIENYYCLIDIAKLGYTSYRTMVRLTNINEQKKQQILDYLLKHGNVLWLVEVGGKWNLLINFMAQDILHYSNILREFKNKFPDQIQNYDVLTTIEGFYFGRDYFTKDKRDRKKQIIFGGQLINKLEIDNLDFKILQHFSEHGRINAIDIAHKAKVSPNTIILRIKSLKDRQ